ncbi:glutathione S-transferase [Ephemerocybe angulata]|uniref:glutathione transferase n=1 Tax=Ephemerocybe angulata TaxID=980116 RepID=A0A8H6HJF6_9AGAR|nr:glutathione S-transferase [Tulosesus angulatus]
MVLKLYAAPQSTASLRVAQVLHEKDVPFEFIPIDLRAKEQKQAQHTVKNPFGQVPYIDDEGFVLYESRAIGRYIALKYAGQGTAGLIPDQSDIKALALFEQAASSEFANFEVHAAKIAYEKLFKVRLGFPTNEEVVKGAIDQLNVKLDVYEGILGKQAYLAGSELTLADLYHIPFGTRLYRAGLGDLIDSRPNVAKWFNGLLARPSWVAIKDGITSTA